MSAAGWYSYLHSATYQERRLSQMSLTNLQREAGSDLERVNNPDLLYYFGLRLNQQGRHELADPVLRRAVTLDPDAPRLRDEWTKALLGSGLTTAAFGQLKQFAGTHPKSAAAHLLLGKFYFTQRSMQRASEEFRQSVTLDSQQGEAWSFLAGSQEALNNLQEARESEAKALALLPDSANDHLMYASLLERANQPDGARREYAAAARLAPRLANVHRSYARWLLASNEAADLRMALQETQLAVQLDAPDAEGQLLLGRALERNGQKEAANAPLKIAAERDPNDSAAPRLLAQIARGQGNTAEAGRWQQEYQRRQQGADEYSVLMQALRVNPRSSELHRRMGRLLGLRGDVGGSLRNYATALRCAPDAPPALIEAANALSDGSHAAAALPLTERAIHLASTNPAAHEAYGNALLGTGQAFAARRAYTKAAGWWPKRIPIMQKRLQAYETERALHPSQAEMAFREARRQLALRYSAARATPLIESLAQKAVALEPTNPDYLKFLLQLQLALRQNADAAKTASRMLTLTPHDLHLQAVAGALMAEQAKNTQEFAEAESHLKLAQADAGLESAWRYGFGLLALQRQQGAQAVKELTRAIELGGATEVTFEKLAQAATLAGETSLAEKALAQSRQIMEEKRQEREALDKLDREPSNPQAFTEAATIFEAHGRGNVAESIRAEWRRRSGSSLESRMP